MGSNRPDKPRRTVVNMGISLMIVILVGMSLAVIAALSISSARNNFDMSEKLKQHNTEYYEAVNLANEKIAASNFADMKFEIEMNESQVLEVEVQDKKVIRFCVVSNANWEEDNTLILLN